jgi:predicted ATPase
MAENKTESKAVEPAPVITRILVEGFKSIVKRQEVEVRPLTIFAGANSSGKSSVMQAVLLLKQTLEAPYDPGPLLLDGPNVAFSSADQLLSRLGLSGQGEQFAAGVGTSQGRLESRFRRASQKPGFSIEQTTFGVDDGILITLHEAMTQDELMAALPEGIRDIPKMVLEGKGTAIAWKVERNRCFLRLGISDGSRDVLSTGARSGAEKLILGIIHLAGLRGNPSRTYPVTAVGPNYVGTFEKYTASVIALWQSDKNAAKLAGLASDLEMLDLAWGVTAKTTNDTQVELQVGRLAHRGKGNGGDMVNIADVGFGVSQTLPVLVALHAAEPQHLVYLEQPEIHLHPRAQYRLAQVLARAVKRGVRAVVETHSSILLQGLQTLVAQGELAPEKVKLHWFSRGEDGATQITPANLDDAGAFGKWPEDFAETNLEAESAYLDAAEARMAGKAGGR